MAASMIDDKIQPKRIDLSIDQPILFREEVRNAENAYLTSTLSHADKDSLLKQIKKYETSIAKITEKLENQMDQLLLIIATNCETIKQQAKAIKQEPVSKSCCQSIREFFSIIAEWLKEKLNYFFD